MDVFHEYIIYMRNKQNTSFRRYIRVFSIQNLHNRQYSNMLAAKLTNTGNLKF